MKIRIVQHCFGTPGSGGPTVALQRFVERSTKSYELIRQEIPAGGINFQIVYRFVLQLRKTRPSLLHVRGLGNEGFHAVLAARLAGVPKILVSVHGTHRDLRDPGNAFRHWVVVNILERLTMALATHIATVCEFTARREFLDPYRHKFVGAIPNGVDLPACRDDRDKVRIKFGISLSSKVAVCVSRITAEKGYIVLAETFAMLDSKVADFTVLVVGGGDEGGALRELFSSLSNIRVLFVGHQKTVREYLAASDFFIFPTLHENLSNALIEAMAHGLPVVATRVGGNTEVLEKGGGLLVPAGDAVALAKGVLSMLNEPCMRQELGYAARSNIAANYSVDRMVSGWEGTYVRILGAENGSR